MTRVQELGRLCRYPSVTASTVLKPVLKYEDRRLGLLAAALTFAHGEEHFTAGGSAAMLGASLTQCPRCSARKVMLQH